MGCAPRCADTSRIDLHMCPIAMAAGGASVQRLAARRAERDSLNAPRNREALYALAQAGRRGVRVDGTRQVQSAESHAA